ncbi:MAG: HEAT repeat domain-containing protein [Planctomycetota bacterium]
MNLLAVVLLLLVQHALPLPSLQRAPARVSVRDEKALLAELERDLEDTTPEKRRSAVKKLRDLATPNAWMLVLRALGDRDAQVADEAQLALGGLREPKVLRAMLGRDGLQSDDEWVALRVAEALGRSELEVHADELVRHVHARAPDLARTIVWSVERLAQRKKLGGDTGALGAALQKLASGARDAGVRAAALIALERIDYFAAKPLIEAALSDRAAEIRCGALLAAGGWPEQECVARSRAALGDADGAVRAQAIENLAKVGSRAAMLELVRWMELEPRTRLRFAILAELQRHSGLANGFDVAAWRSWAETITGAVTTGVGGTKRAPVLGDTRVGFAGMNTLSDRVVFLVDFSGSLWMTKVGARTRKELVDGEMRKALQSLPKNTEFNVIPYTGEPFPWSDALVPSSAANVKRALEFFERCHQTGKGDYFGAVQLALRDPKVDTIVVLTDGAPTGGRRWNLELMVELLAEANRFRKIAFDSVLVGGTRTQQRHWSELARRTGGRSMVAEMSEEGVTAGR